MTDASRDEIVEQAAKALWQDESVRATGQPRRCPWLAESEETREKWRRSAKVVVALFEKSGLLRSHGISHGREGYDYGPGSAGAPHPSRDSTEEEA